MRILSQLSYILPIGGLISMAVMGQNSRSDSLQNLLASLPPQGVSFATDTTRVMLWCELGRAVSLQKSMLILENASSLAQKINWSKGKIRAYMELSVTSGYLTSYYRGCQFLFKALSIAEQQKDTEIQGRILFQMGNYYSQMGDPLQGLKRHLQALKVIGSNSTQKAKMFNIIGTDYYLLKNSTAAKKYFTQGLKVSRQTNNYKVASYCLVNLAVIALENNQLKTSLLYFQQYDSLLNHYKMPKESLYEGMSKWYLRKGLLQKAKDEALKLYQFATQTGELQILSTAHKTLYEYYNQTGNSSLALKHHQEWVTIKEKNQEEMQKKMIDALRFEYENESQRLKINRLEYEQNLFLIGVAALMIVGGLLFWNNRTLTRKNAQIAQQRNELSKLKDDLAQVNQKLIVFNENLEQKVQERTEALTRANEELTRKNHEIQEAFWSGTTQERKRVASELHDNLGSTVSGLIWQLQSIKPENLTESEQEIYDGLIEQMRNAYFDIRHISHHLLPLELEKGLDRALERLTSDLNRAGKIIFSLKGKIPNDSLTKTQQTELYSICLEIINNTLKHAQATQCIIQFEQKGNTLIIHIKDNGQGFDLYDLGNRGRGLANIEERVKTLHGTLKITSEIGQGTSFTFFCLLNSTLT